MSLDSAGAPALPTEAGASPASSAATAPAPLLVLGWGNLSRGDDALGPLCLQRLRDAGLAEAEATLLDDYQLQVEHALDLVGRRRVLLVDASLDAAAPFEVRRVQPARDASWSTHAMSPGALLQVLVQLQQPPERHPPPPECTLLAIRGERFELGEPPGAAALAHLEAAMVWVQRWLADDSPLETAPPVAGGLPLGVRAV